MKVHELFENEQLAIQYKERANAERAAGGEIIINE